MEALAGLREEERVRIFQREIAADLGIGNDVTVAELRQNYLKRLAEAVEHANAVLQRHNGVAVRDVICSPRRIERELCLRIFGVDQERRAAIDIGAQQAQAFVGGIPGLHHDVVQLVAQEVVDHVLVAVFDFEEIGQHSGRARRLVALPEVKSLRTDSVE